MIWSIPNCPCKNGLGSKRLKPMVNEVYELEAFVSTGPGTRAWENTQAEAQSSQIGSVGMNYHRADIEECPGLRAKVELQYVN